MGQALLDELMSDCVVSCFYLGCKHFAACTGPPGGRQLLVVAVCYTLSGGHRLWHIRMSQDSIVDTVFERLTVVTESVSLRRLCVTRPVTAI